MRQVVATSVFVAVAIVLLCGCRSPHELELCHDVAIVPFSEAVDFGFGNFEGEPFILYDPQEVKDIMVNTGDPRFSTDGQLDFIREILAEHGCELILRSKASPVYEVIRSRPGGHSRMAPNQHPDTYAERPPQAASFQRRSGASFDQKGRKK